MRMRKRKNLDPRMERAAEWLIQNPEELASYWQQREISPVPAKRTPGSATRCVELGCGMGRFACETAAARPDALVVGLERIPDALIIGMERAQGENLQNIRFVLGDVNNLNRFFAPGGIDELYIHFCDPWPHWKRASRRLVARGFLQLYRPLLAPNGFLRFKTDNAPLFAFAQKELAAENWTITECSPDSPPGDIQTEYEMKFRAKGVPIGVLTAKAPVNGTETRNNV